MPVYCIGTVNKNGEELLWIASSCHSIEYTIWKVDGKYCIRNKVSWGKFARFYNDLWYFDNLDEAGIVLDWLLGGINPDPDNFVECRLCHNLLTNLESSHVVKKHGISIDDYKKMFPDAALISPSGYELISSAAKSRSNDWWIGRKHTEETKKKMSESAVPAAIKRWSDPEYKNKQVRAIMLGANLEPNPSEQFIADFLDENFPGEWKYVGDGSFVVGGRSPDFMHTNGKKLLIEKNGCRYHACEKCGWNDVVLRNGTMTAEDIRLDDAGKLEMFMEHGFKTLVVWDHEFKCLPALLERIDSFSVAGKLV